MGNKKPKTSINQGVREIKTIITIQHTQSVHHTNGMIGSWTDWDLTERGKDEAEKIARALTAERDLSGFKIFSSDLKRAVQTANPLAKILDKFVQEDSRIRERNLGEACGKSVEWLKENIEKHEENVEDKLFPSAESKIDSWKRLKPFFEEMMEQENVIIIAHGDILTQFYSIFLRHSVEELNAVEFSGQAGGVSVFNVLDSGKRIIRKINDTHYKS